MSKKDKAEKKSRPAGEGGSSGGPGKGKGRARPPLERALVNVTKIDKSAELVLKKLSSWAANGDPRIANAASQMKQITAGAQAAKDVLQTLLDEGFQPPKKSASAGFESGEAVAIKEAQRERYSHAYPEEIFSALTVESITPVGDVVVKNGVHKFFVAKSHLEHRS